jgi:hypothetical protein
LDLVFFAAVLPAFFLVFAFFVLRAAMIRNPFSR